MTSNADFWKGATEVAPAEVEEVEAPQAAVYNGTAPVEIAKDSMRVFPEEGVVLDVSRGFITIVRPDTPTKTFDIPVEGKRLGDFENFKEEAAYRMQLKGGSALLAVTPDLVQFPNEGPIGEKANYLVIPDVVEMIHTTVDLGNG